MVGLQGHCRRRHLRRAGERAADGRDLRPVPRQPQAFRRRAAIHLPRGDVDCVGEVLPGGSVRQLAVARLRQCVRALDPPDPVVRMDRHARRLAVDMGGQPRPVRADGRAFERMVDALDPEGALGCRNRSGARARRPDRHIGSALPPLPRALGRRDPGCGHGPVKLRPLAEAAFGASMGAERAGDRPVRGRAGVAPRFLRIDAADAA